jgi:hypothetical protein
MFIKGHSFFLDTFRSKVLGSNMRIIRELVDIDAIFPKAIAFIGSYLLSNSIQNAPLIKAHFNDFA